MKKLFTLLCCVATLGYFTSCQKDISTENFPPGPDSTNTGGATDSNSRIKSYTETITSAVNGNRSVTFNIAYDGAGKITSLTSASNPGDKFIYTYTGIGKVTLEIFNSNILSIHEDGFTNASLLLDSTYQYNDTQDTSTEKYVYNPEKQLIAVYHYEVEDGVSRPSDTTTYTYNTDGDLIKESSTDRNIKSYTYYADLSYPPIVVTGIPTIYTTGKKHLIKTISLVSNGFPAGNVSLTYTFDSLNRLSTETAIADDGSTAVKTYTY